MDANSSLPFPSEPLLLLPGLMCDARVFAAQRAAFADAVAAPDYGDLATLGAMAERVLALAPARFAVLGHSMGARVALEVVRRAPGRVTRLALVSTGVHLPLPSEPEKRHALRDVGRLHGMAALVDAWLPPMVAPSRKSDTALLLPLRAMCIEAGLAQFEAQIAALLARPEVETLLPHLAGPVRSHAAARTAGARPISTRRWQRRSRTPASSWSMAPDTCCRPKRPTRSIPQSPTGSARRQTRSEARRNRYSTRRAR